MNMIRVDALSTLQGEVLTWAHATIPDDSVGLRALRISSHALDVTLRSIAAPASMEAAIADVVLDAVMLAGYLDFNLMDALTERFAAYPRLEREGRPVIGQCPAARTTTTRVLSAPSVAGKAGTTR